MQDAGFTSNIQSTNTTGVAAQNGQINSASVNSDKSIQQNTSIFNGNNNNINNANISQSNSNSQGTGGIGNIFTGGISVQTGVDNTSIFNGLNRGANYSLYSKKDTTFDVPKLTQETIAAQKGIDKNDKITNPKAYNIDLTPKENPYAAFRNPEMQEDSIKVAFGKLTEKISAVFNQKKAD